MINRLFAFFFSLWGYCDVLTLRDFCDEDIQYIETQNKTATVNKVTGKADPIWFLSCFYNDNPENFEFNRGERKRLSQLADLLKNVKNQNELFSMEKFKIDHCQVFYSPKTEGYYFGKQNAIPFSTNGTVNNNISIQDQENNLKGSLKSKLIEISNISETETENLLAGNITVSAKGNEFRGSIICGYCNAENKKIIISVSTKTVAGRKKSGIYWTLSNWVTHIKRSHSNLPKQAAFVVKSSPIEKLTIEQTIESEEIAEETVNEINIADIENDQQLNDASNFESEKEDDFEMKSVSVNNILSQDDLEKRIFSNISSQLTNMSSLVHLHNLDVKEMNFKIGTDMTSLGIVATRPDGNCMFQSLVHQLHFEEVNSKVQNGRDHYDSIMSIEQKDVFSIAKILAERFFDNMRTNIEPLELFDTEEEGFEN